MVDKRSIIGITAKNLLFGAWISVKNRVTAGVIVKKTLLMAGIAAQIIWCIIGNIKQTWRIITVLVTQTKWIMRTGNVSAFGRIAEAAE